MGQARAVPAGTAYVTLLAGLTDICGSAVTSTGRMLAPETFAAHVRKTLLTVYKAAPGVRVLVASIPDVTRIWQSYRSNAEMAVRWRRPGTCPLALGPQATASTRDQLRLMTIEYDVLLRTTCATFLSCRYGGGSLC